MTLLPGQTFQTRWTLSSDMFDLIFLASVHLDSLRDISHMDDLAQDKTFAVACLQTKISI